MTVAQRKGISNALWLCNNCSVLIDRDADRFPAVTLRAWKTIAEQHAEDEQLRPLPSHDDALKLMSAALTGQSLSFMPTLIDNAHRASERALTALDARFEVSTSRTDEGTSVVLRAKEPVDLSITVPSDRAHEWISQFRDLVDDAREITMDATGVGITGSPLVEELHNGRGYGAARTLQFSPPSSKFLLKWQLRTVDETNVEALDDAKGRLKFGRKMSRFEAVVWQGLAHIELASSYQNVPSAGKLSLNINYARWQGRSVHDLPYFDPCLDLHRRVVGGDVITFSIWKNGKKAAGAKTEPHQAKGFNRGLTILEYLNLARQIATAMGVDAVIPSKLVIDPKRMKQMRHLAEIAAGEARYGADDLQTNLTFRITVNGDGANVRELLSLAPGRELLLTHEDGATVDLLGHPIPLLPIVVRVRNGQLRALDSLDGAKDGEDIRMEVIPQADFLMTYEFQSAEEHAD